MYSDGINEYMEEILAVSVDIPDASTRRAIELIMLLIQDVRSSMNAKIEGVKASTAKKVSFGIDSALKQLAQKSPVETSTQMTAKVHQPHMLKPTAQKVAKPEPHSWCPILPQKSVPLITPSVRAANPHSWCPMPAQKSVPLITSSKRVEVKSGTSLSGESTSASASEAEESPRNVSTSSNGASQNASRVGTSPCGVDTTELPEELPLWLQISASMPTRNM